MLGIRVSPELAAEMNELAKVTHRSLAWIGEDAIKQYCRVQRWQLKEISESFTESESDGPVIQNEDMEAWLSSWGKPREKRAPKA